MTARRLDLESLPHWPRFLNLSEAAAYVGVSPSVFLTEVKNRVWPEPKRRGAKAALATWDKALLDSAADRDAGITPAGAPLPSQAVDEEAMRQEMREKLRATAAQRGAKKGRLKT
jgi:hypothetical protein